MKAKLIWTHRHYKYIGRHAEAGHWYCSLCHQPAWIFYSGIWETLVGTPFCDCEGSKRKDVLRQERIDEKNRVMWQEVLDTMRDRIARL